MARPGNYLVRRGKSGVWHCRFQYTGDIAVKMGEREFEFSLRTTDPLEAEIRALPHIRAHKLTMLSVRQMNDGTFNRASQPKYEPNREHITPEGKRLIATEEKLLSLDDDGKIVRTASNEKTVADALGFAMDAQTKEWKVLPKETGRAAHSLEEQIVASWVTQRKPNKHLEREARKGWEMWKKVVNGKSIRQCTRDDGRKLVAALQAEGMKAATIGKYLSHLNAATNMAINDAKLKFNPFSGVAPKVDDDLEREPYTDDHMTTMRKAIDNFEADERRLWVLLATTGMRRGEAFEIDREFEEPALDGGKGIRYVIVGTKTDASKRRVPLPKGYLDLYPETITGPLFPDTPNNTSRRLLRRSRALGITDPRYVVHSLRHRAKDRMRAFACPGEVQSWMLGHDSVTVADDYGKGPPVSRLKPWIDLIGF
jgi:integrase